MTISREVKSRLDRIESKLVPEPPVHFVIQFIEPKDGTITSYRLVDGGLQEIQQSGATETVGG